MDKLFTTVLRSVPGMFLSKLSSVSGNRILSPGSSNNHSYYYYDFVNPYYTESLGTVLGSRSTNISGTQGCTVTLPYVTTIHWLDFSFSPPRIIGILNTLPNGAYDIIWVNNQWICVWINSDIKSVMFKPVSFNQTGQLITGYQAPFNGYTMHLIDGNYGYFYNGSYLYVMSFNAGPKFLYKINLGNSNLDGMFKLNGALFFSEYLGGSDQLYYIIPSSPYAKLMTSQNIAGAGAVLFHNVVGNILVSVQSATPSFIISAYDFSDITSPQQLNVVTPSLPGGQHTNATFNFTANSFLYGDASPALYQIYASKIPASIIPDVELQYHGGPVPLTRLRNATKVYPFFGLK